MLFHTSKSYPRIWEIRANKADEAKQTRQTKTTLPIEVLLQYASWDHEASRDLDDQHVYAFRCTLEHQCLLLNGREDMYTSSMKIPQASLTNLKSGPRRSESLH